MNVPAAAKSRAFEPLLWFAMSAGEPCVENVTLCVSPLVLFQVTDPPANTATLFGENDDERSVTVASCTGSGGSLMDVEPSLEHAEMRARAARQAKWRTAWVIVFSLRSVYRIRRAHAKGAPVRHAHGRDASSAGYLIVTRKSWSAMRRCTRVTMQRERGAAMFATPRSHRWPVHGAAGADAIV